MKDTWGYVRHSQESDDSLEEQKELIREYAKANSLNLQTTRNDGRKTSGFNEDREEYQLIREKIRAADIDAIITRDRARMSRDFDERLRLIATMRDTGVEWHVVEEGGRLHLEDVQQAGMECLHAMMDHVKKMVEIERSRKAIEKRHERGCYQGGVPKGLAFADDNCHLERGDDWDLVERVFEMTADGEAQRAISRETGITQSTVATIQDRGIEWYEELLEEYGE